MDGNRNPLFDANGNCAVTNQGNPSWWRVDLGANNVPVADIFIVNRLYPPSEISEVFYDIRVGKKEGLSMPLKVQSYLFFTFLLSFFLLSGDSKKKGVFLKDLLKYAFLRFPKRSLLNSYNLFPLYD